MVAKEPTTSITVPDALLDVIAATQVPGEDYTYADAPECWTWRKDKKTGETQRGTFSKRRMLLKWVADNLPNYQLPEGNWGGEYRGGGVK